MSHLHWLAGATVVIAAAVGLARSPSGIGPDERPGPIRAVASATPGTEPAEHEQTVASSGPAAQSLAPATAMARQVAANELGDIPVLMYHRIVPKAPASLDRTPRQLRRELEQLAEQGYVPITAAQLVSGRIDIPAGRHPVVLSFDDGYPSQFALDARGDPRPDTAVGILMEVARRHPGFRPVATFYVNRRPFQLNGAARTGFQWLVKHGFEIGNHTLTHADLSRMSKQQIQQEISAEDREIVQLTGAHATTFAFPYGAVPRQRDRVLSMPGGYAFRGAFLAGWKPAPSPFATDFDPLAVPRIRSEDRITQDDCRRYCSLAWLEWLNKHPAERYTSDGDRNVISFPRGESARLDNRFTGLGRFY